MDDTAVKGWRGFKFLFGTGLHQHDEQEQTEQELTVMLEHHIEELAFGGYRAAHIEEE